MLTASKKLQLIRYINSARDSQRDFLTALQEVIDRHDASTFTKPTRSFE